MFKIGAVVAVILILAATIPALAGEDGVGLFDHRLMGVTPDQLIRALNADGGVRVRQVLDVDPGDPERSFVFRFGQCIDATVWFDFQSNHIKLIGLMPTSDDHAGCTVAISSAQERNMVSEATARIVYVVSSVHVDRTKISNQIQKLRRKATPPPPNPDLPPWRQPVGEADLIIGDVSVTLTETLGGVRDEYRIYSAD
jgi:hypothetical protein